ncbi:BRO family protein [Roseospira marina]|uniref:BRO family protein n=1 Tax=Roseospira marina TaxID=140057 RepID=UPI0014780EA9|nr:phage antirepressor KilAC domain-containing protein [Roseospira marina]MBB4313007.1 anti-repressor protein [Roseospira marina]MBB5086220.1 anti-repressor protein [Roseospira marina]
MTKINPNNGTTLVPFDFEGATVRVLDIDGEPWFVAKDVATVLGYSNPQKAVRDHCKGPRPVGGNESFLPLDRPVGVNESFTLDRQTVIIPERDVYRLIMRSNLPSAERFEELVVGDILPTIRKTGSYGIPRIDVRDPSQLSQIAIQLIEVNKELTVRAERAEQQVEAAKPKTQFYDKYANADGLYNLQNAARVLCQGPNKFVGWLKQGYLFYQGTALVPKVKYREMGVFEVKATVVDDKARYQTFVTPKGIQYLAKKLGVDRLPLEEAA